MAKKKNLKGIDESDMEFIDTKMFGGNEKNDKASFVSYDYKITVKCKNQKQKEFYKLLKDENKEIVFGIGSAGSGKSYISLSYALQSLKDVSSPYKQIICLNPTCEAGSKALNLGFLKGSLEEKLMPYIEADAYSMEKILNNSGNYCSKSLVDGLIRNQKIKYELINFARGKNYDNALILINEAENYSKEEMLLLLTRIGENSKVVITGDLEQVDRKDFKSKSESGLAYAINKLQSMEEVGVIEFKNEDIVRNPLIGKIIDTWKK